MLIGIVWTVVLFRTKPTAINVANQSSQKDLDKFECSRYKLVNNSFESFRKNFNQTDQADITRQSVIKHWYPLLNLSFVHHKPPYLNFKGQATDQLV